MIGYDDIYSIEYMYEKRMGYWKHDGKVTIFDAFEKLRDNYQSIMERFVHLMSLFIAMQKKQVVKNMQKYALQPIVKLFLLTNYLQTKKAI